MATELTLTGDDAGSAVYAVLRRDSDEKVYSTVASAWVTFVVADYANYDVALAETPANSRFWVADLPTAAAGTTVHVTYYRRAGGSPSIANDALLGGETLYPSGVNPTASTTTLITQAEYEAVVDTDASDAKLQFLISAASAAIQNYCNFTFVSETVTEYIDGTGYNFLDLEARPLTLTTVTQDPEGTTPTTYTVSDLAWSDQGRLYFKPSATAASAFACGHRNWKVEYTSYGVVPDDLKAACIAVVQAMEFEADGEKYVSEKAVRDQKIKWDTSFLESVDGLFAGAKALLAPFRHFACI